MMKRMARVTPIVVILSLLLSSCSMHLGLSKLVNGGASAPKPTRAAPAAVSAIALAHGRFRPKNVTVKVGATLTWTNNNDTQESVTSDSPGAFDSGPLASGATWQHTFDKPGVFPYHSTGSPNLYGSVTVTP